MTGSTLDLIDRIGHIEVHPFLAPIPDASRVLVTTVQENVQFKYQIVKEPGWWVLYCDQSTVRRVEATVGMFEIVQFLDALPRFIVIAVHRLRADTWMVVPWNTSDATQRGWPDGEPMAMHLVRDAIRPFDVVIARRLGRTILYDTLDDGLGTAAIAKTMRDLFDSGTEDAITPGAPSEMRRACSLLVEYASALARMDPNRAESKQRTAMERKLRWHLAFVGAELLGWNESGEGYQVRWSHEGREYSTLLRRDLQVASAGICLDGTDLHHNLSSIVGVMEEAQHEGMEY
jgi:hypothetical protein